ncbi:MAG: hypothetical protein WC492_00175 [Candidatus Micrarchaeia archaeon]
MKGWFNLQIKRRKEHKRNSFILPTPINIVMKINAKHLLAGLLLSFALLAICIILFPAPQMEGTLNAGSNWIGVHQALPALYGQENSLWLDIEGKGFEGYELDVCSYEQEIPVEIVLVKGNWAGAGTFSKLEGSLKKEVQKTAWKFDVVPLENIGIDGERKIFVMPSGAWPLGLQKNISKVFGENSTLVYMGVVQNISISKEGSAKEGGAPEFLSRAQGNTEFEDVESGFGVRVIVARKTIDEIADVDAFTQRLVQKLETSPNTQEGKIACDKKLIGKDGFVGVVKSISAQQDIWMRASARDADGRLARMWDMRLPKNVGRVVGSKSASANLAVSFQSSITPEYVQNEEIEYFAVVLTPKREVFAQKSLGRNTMEGSKVQDSKAAWIGSFVQQNWPQAEYAIVEIQDQFGRAYARAVVRLAKYQAVLVQKNSGTRNYLILEDGAPLQAGFVDVRKNESAAWVRVPLLSSKASVASRWVQGQNKIIFRIGQAEITDSWVEESGERWSIFFAFVCLVSVGMGTMYLVLGRNRAREYKLIVDEFPQSKRQEVRIDKKELEKIVSAPMSLEIIVHKINEKFTKNKREVISIESVENALTGLVKEGRLREHMQYYAQVAEYSARELEQIVVRKIITDKLLARGVSLGENLKDSEGRQWKICLKGEEEKLLREINEVPNFIVFYSQKEIERFLKLTHFGGQWAQKIRLALMMKKLKLIDACRIET